MIHLYRIIAHCFCKFYVKIRIKYENLIIGGVMAYRETIVHGDNQLPLAVYHLTKDHPRYRMNPHWHPEIEILIVNEGVFHLHLNDKSYSLKKGSVTLIASGNIHAGEPDNCDYTCILVNPKLLMKSSDKDMSFFTELQSENLQVKTLLSECSEEYYPLCRQMQEIWEERSDGFPFFMKSLIFQFWGTILHRKDYEKGEREKLSESQISRMKNVISYLEENYQNKIRLDDLAKKSDLSPNYFCKLFRQVTGFSPYAYLQYYRLEKARYALQTTDQTITEVAFNCGFSDVSHFIKEFRGLYGTTPKQFNK